MHESPKLIGRQREMSALVAAGGRTPAVIVVEGEAGVGKTRLVRNWLAHPSVQRRRVLTGHCHDLHDPLPLWPVVEALRRGAQQEAAAGTTLLAAPVSARAGVLRPHLPELAAQLPPRPAPLGDDRAERCRLTIALREVLGAIGPVVLVLEDLHWTDDGTVDFLLSLQPDLPPDLVLVLTYRREGDNLPPSLFRLIARLGRQALTTTISLAPFGPAEVSELVGAIMQYDEVPADMAALLHERTGGLPFAVEEVVRLLRDRGGTGRLGWPWSPADLDRVGVPPALRDSVLERVGLLSEDAQSVVRAAAVIGPPPADEATLARVARLAGARSRRALSAAVSAALLREVEPRSYACRHELARQAVYDAVPGPERGQFHLRAARTLEAAARVAGGTARSGEPDADPGRLARLVYHFKEASQPAEWGAYAEAAAYAVLGDERATAGFLRDGLSAPGQPFARRVRMARRLGLAALYDTIPQVDISLLRPLLADTRLSGGTRGELRLYLAGLLHHAGEPEQGREEMVRAARELGRRPELGAHAMVNLSLPHFGRVHVDEHLAWLKRAVTTAQRADEAAGVRITVPVHRAAVLFDVGDPAGWRALEEIPMATSSTRHKLELARAYVHLASALSMLGYFERAEPLIEQVACIEANVGYLGWGDELGNLNAWTDWATGRWKRLEASIEELDGEADDGASRYRTVSGSLLASKGRHETAEVRLREDMERAMEAGRLPEILGSSASLARCLLSQGKPVESVEVTTRSLELLRSKGIWVWSTDLVPVAIDALLTVGRTGEAHRVEEEMAASLAGRDAPAAGGALTWCRGALAEAAGDHALAAEHFGQADAVWSRLPRPYDAARARERQGRAVLNVTEQADLGTDLLVGALSDYSDLGATDDVARVKELLRSHRIDVPYPWRGGRYSYGKDLSPREMSVARRAALGQTNLEIAKDLFLSPKTVERHMAKAMRKLGVRRRAALAAALVPTNTGDD